MAIKSKATKCKQSITIGKRDADSDLVNRILTYQKKKGLRSAADAVRQLCDDALKFKEAAK